MLVLSRLPGKSIMIGKTKIILLTVQGDKVRLGIKAPSEIPVHRQEVYDAIERDKAQG